MDIIVPYARLFDVHDQHDGIALLKKIEWCGRISHRSEDAVTETSYDRFIHAVVMGHGDFSIAEHAVATVDATMDRGLTHEWVRHRLFSVTQESTRFVNYEKKNGPKFIYPFEHDPFGGGAFEKAWTDAMKTCEAAYKILLSKGWAPQLARSAFPTALASRIVTTGNLRNWRHFLLMRTTRETHPQMRTITIPLLREFQAKIPILYDDIVPGATQADNMRMMR